jgi:hypothetical protein
LTRTQVFFNTVHVGGAADVMDAEKTGVLQSLLVDLARSADVDFPPPPEAAMVELIAFISLTAAAYMRLPLWFSDQSNRRNSIFVATDRGAAAWPGKVRIFFCDQPASPAGEWHRH